MSSRSLRQQLPADLQLKQFLTGLSKSVYIFFFVAFDNQGKIIHLEKKEKKGQSTRSPQRTC